MVCLCVSSLSSFILPGISLVQNQDISSWDHSLLVLLLSMPLMHTTFIKGSFVLFSFLREMYSYLEYEVSIRRYYLNLILVWMHLEDVFYFCIDLIVSFLSHFSFSFFWLPLRGESREMILFHLCWSIFCHLSEIIKMEAGFGSVWKF